MKVLMLHNRYKVTGGEDISTEAEVALLKENGVHVDELYVTNDDLEKYHKVKIAYNSVWSWHYYSKILKKIQIEKYDIVHVQNFLPLLSPSIFYACKKANTKVVMSVRNYRLVCPNALMYVNGAICQECVGKGIPSSAILKRCYRESISASLTAVAMLSIHNILKTWGSKINGLICISDFVKSQLMKGGFKEEQLYVKYNFVTTDVNPEFEAEDYYIYIGRLSVEKGLDVLLNSFRNNNRKLIIVGDGPLKNAVIKGANENNLIQYVGKKSLKDTYKLVAKARALIFPSKWHEPFGRTIVEAFAHATPVIGSRLGGITELIKEGYNGYSFDPYKDGDLNKAIQSLESYENPTILRNNAYKSYNESFLPTHNFAQLLNIYQHVLSHN